MNANVDGPERVSLINILDRPSTRTARSLPGKPPAVACWVSTDERWPPTRLKVAAHLDHAHQQECMLPSFARARQDGAIERP